MNEASRDGQLMNETGCRKLSLRSSLGRLDLETKPGGWGEAGPEWVCSLSRGARGIKERSAIGCTLSGE